MDKCRAFKNKTTLIQCTASIKNGFFCGKHQNYGNPVYDTIGLRLTGEDTVNRAIISIDSNTKGNNNINNNFGNKSDNNSGQSGQSGHSGHSGHSGQSGNKSDKAQVYKNLENSELYNDYLATRRLYIKDKETINNHVRPIELLEYMETSKLELYPYPRLLITLEYYKLIKSPELYRNTSKFLLITENLAKLESFFSSMIKASIHLDKVIKLQKWIKMRLSLFNKKLHGIALVRRSLCVNDSDFVSLDDIKDISLVDFVSFQDACGFVYGFNLDSVVDLILKSDEHFIETFKKNYHGDGNWNLCYRQFIRILYNHYNKIKINNPYTRDILPGEFKLNVFRLYARKIYSIKPNQNTTGNNTLTMVNGAISGNGGNDGDHRMRVRNKCFAIFQKIDMFGYMTDITWLMDENVKNIKLFYKKLAFQWNLEFGLDNTARYRIARTHNLFNNLHEVMLSRLDKYNLLDKILDILNILVSNGESESDKNTGAILILYGLAAINRRCIEANPWLS